MAKDTTMISAAYCSRELCALLERKGIEAHSVQQFVKGGSWYRKYTQDVVCRWIREVHHLHIEILAAYHFRVFDGYSFEVYNISESEFVNYASDKGTFPTAEEAREMAIQYCVENLI